MVALGGTSNPQTIEYVTAFFSFFTVVFGGLLIGILVGLLCSYILKVSDLFCAKTKPQLAKVDLLETIRHITYLLLEKSYDI